MSQHPLSEVLGVEDPLTTIVTRSRKLAEYHQLFSNFEEVKYYSQFPQIQSALSLLENKAACLIKSIGTFIGLEYPSKNNLKLSATSEIVVQYLDNIEIKIKKFQEEEQRIRIRQKNPQTLLTPTRPHKLWGLKHPLRVVEPAPFSYQSVNHQDCIRPSQNIAVTPLTWVDTEERFMAMLQKLSSQKQIAVDLQHSDQSYYGFTCLIQISTRVQDFIVDVLPLWTLVHQLNQVFNNPSILKVFHGAKMDIKWLHRDFDVNVCHLFDTYHAGQQLQLKPLSYAFLLKHYTGTQTNKKYQLADWGQRPLSPQMLHYARVDTHYLLEIYDRMKSEIMSKAVEAKVDPRQALKSVFSHSKDVAQTRWREPQLKESRDFRETMERQIQNKGAKKGKVLQKLYQLRDNLAREEDQNAYKLIGNKYLFELADKKEFEPSEVAKTFRKDLALKKYISRICSQMQEFYLKLKDEVDQVKSKIVPTVPNPTEESKQHKGIYQPVEELKDFQELYFDLHILGTCSLTEYKTRTLDNHKSKSILTFECPLSYQLNRFKVTQSVSPTQ